MNCQMECLYETLFVGRTKFSMENSSFRSAASLLALAMLLYGNKLLVSASSISATSSYQSVRDLDQYGNAVQLKHAQAAADTQGNLVVILDRNSSHWVVSIDAAFGRRKNQRMAPKLVHFLYTPQDNHYEAIICSGIQADASWLTRQLQMYIKNRWERYSQYHGTGTAQAIAQYKRAFWGYDVDDMYQGPAYTATEDRWSRPLGIRTAVLSQFSPRLQVVEPSGVVHRVQSLACLGKNGVQIQTALETRLQNMQKAVDSDTVVVCDDEELQRAIVEVLSSTLGCSPSDVQIHVVSPDGVQQLTVKGGSSR
ncbi:predicted protein [Phaeodactylum tricornutum CCAP 1055/1]|uniref:Uncharacterized protein n=2 Tax=Phaeodactylum tricornutum TaxID=2850 RepID=B7G8T8_PHATC|nr:predicted protein [Phaeodactylum tricornutum CCAP 1055/1]EEC45226.1 predicted protein [Phaeodactylum tricornutum CCAP 1055/1]|eukprot:XP_002183526.1 predicted protein [Phaeodactylum tricornutum CCAP 1055/1]